MHICTGRQTSLCSCRHVSENATPFCTNLISSCGCGQLAILRWRRCELPERCRATGYVHGLKNCPRTGPLRSRKKHDRFFPGTHRHVFIVDTEIVTDMSPLETITYGIDLSKDWTNTSLELVQTPRPAGSLALNYQRLWWSSIRNAVFCFGGEVTSAPGVSETASLSEVPPESIWQYVPSGNGSGAWSEAVGPTGNVPYPASALRAANGAAASDGEHGYYIGGYIDQLTTKTFHNFPWPTYRQAGGLQTFDFGSLNLTNSSDGGYFASQYYYNESFYYDPGCMLYTPLFGAKGLLILLGGGGQSGPFVHEWLPNQGDFDNITIYDIHTQTWLSQKATGTIPDPRAKFCAVGVANGDNSTFDM